MIIEINEKESYTIEIPEKLTRQDFLGMFERFGRIAKIIGRDEISELSQSSETESQTAVKIKKKKKGKKFTTLTSFDRGSGLALLKEFYSKKRDRNNKVKFASKYGFRSYTSFKVVLHYLKKNYKFKERDYL